MKWYKKTPDDLRRVSISDTVKEVLGSDYVRFNVDQLTLQEDLVKKTSDVKFSLRISGSTEQGREILGGGVGLMDAVFNSLFAELSKEYCSLQTISLEDFNASVNPSTSKKMSGTDMSARVDLVVDNTSRTSIHFYSESRSIATACIDVVIQAVEYYVNCELAVLKLSELLEDAKERQRMDLHDMYLRQLTEVVGSNTYVEVLKRLKNKN